MSGSQSDDVSVKRLSDGDSFGKGSMRSGQNSIAGMSRGSFTSQGSKGIRNFLGSKFNKRAMSISKQEAKKQEPAKSSLYMPGQTNPMGSAMKGQIRDNTILEDQDSELDNASDLSADALIYNYDVINLKEETSVYHNPIKDILDIY